MSTPKHPDGAHKTVSEAVECPVPLWQKMGAGHPRNSGPVMPESHPEQPCACGVLASSFLDPRKTPTVSIPAGGALLGLDRNAAYRAARQGYLPTVQVSERRWVVPTAALLKMLGMGGE